MALIFSAILIKLTNMCQKIYEKADYCLPIRFGMAYAIGEKEIRDAANRRIIEGRMQIWQR